MSEERENEREMGRIEHFCHPHPLALRVVGKDFGGWCHGCNWMIHPEERAYTCSMGCRDPILHEECAEMPRQIRMLMHPQHILIQLERGYFAKCAICEIHVRIGYFCARSDGCQFQIHIGCAHNYIEVPLIRIDHPSHPQHQLSLSFRSGSSRCNACGTIERGNFYVCTSCQYWIHDSCGDLSPTEHFKQHHHPLSLIYYLPLEYIKYRFSCNICFKALHSKYWLYHCEICKYVVHIKCAIRFSQATIDADAAEDEGVVTFPVNNVVEELISSLVTKVGGVMANPNEIVNCEYEFHSHEHQLRLIKEEEDEGEGEDETSDEDDFNYRDSQLVCDGCTLPIFPKKQENYYCKYYMSCGECKYFLHWACFHLPFEIPSHPLHPDLNHILTLRTCPKLDYGYCDICSIRTNGLFYECTKCGFVIDVKCVSLPNTIKHKAHPRHYLKLPSEPIRNNISYGRVCSACGLYTYARHSLYECDVCKVFFHASCVLLPAVITNRGWDKHPLPLAFDASVDHPSSFCCDICEEEMNPKLWMYHCRTCDFSAHPKCFPTASGMYRNIKFGQRDVVASVHDHPVAFQLLTKKLHCDVCGRGKAYGSQVFQCVSDKCEFFMCLIPCYYIHRAEMKVLIEGTSSSNH